LGGGGSKVTLGPAQNGQEKDPEDLVKHKKVERQSDEKHCPIELRSAAGLVRKKRLRPKKKNKKRMRKQAPARGKQKSWIDQATSL